MAALLANRYQLIKQLGHGGMADVYLAMDTVLKREVAIKILRGELASDPVALLRFQREANAVSELSHTNIVQIYDVGEEAGRQYIVMEYINGKTLKQFLSVRGALYKEEAVFIMKQLVSAIVEANAKNIIHRDIKPQNVLIKDDGTIKITDFGIALAQDAMELTDKDSVMGSVHYLAPELARGEVATPASDIYSMGIVFYELLTGEVPFRGESAVQIAMKHISEPMPSVRTFNPSLPQAIDNIVAKATAKNPMYRYGSAKEMLNDLNTVLDPSRAGEAKVQVEPEGVGDTTKVMPFSSTGKKTDEKRFFKTAIGIGLGVMSLVMIIALASLTLNWANNNKKIKIPDIIGMSQAEAEAALPDNLTVKYEWITTDNTEKDHVDHTSPATGTEVSRGVTITVYISKGKFIIIDDYAGKNYTLEALQQVFAGTRITISTEYVEDKDHAAGLILEVTGVAVGDKVDPSIAKQIKVKVSSYPRVNIPYTILGMNIYDAKALLEAEGCVVVLDAMDASQLPPENQANLRYEVVIATNPEPGTYYEQTPEAVIHISYYQPVP
ncbi:MAG: protein kinase [Erysipelotrichaceae bacterium]|nr:protein kinase [Erysipelotrichaceae bacterium]